MTWIFGDGFDTYTGSLDIAEYWDFCYTDRSNIDTGEGLGGGGAYAPIGGYISGPMLYKSSGVNDAVHHLSFAYLQHDGIGTTYPGITFQLYDGTTPQFCVTFMNDGSVQFLRGDYAGALLAVFPGAFTFAEDWNQFEIEIVIHPTAGSFAIRKNGNTVNDLSRTAQNTRTTANSYANGFGMVVYNPYYDSVVDDFLWRSGTTVPWAGNTKCFTRWPGTIVSTQFVPYDDYWQYNNGGGNTSPAIANSAYYCYMIVDGSGTLQNVQFTTGLYTTTYTGNLKMSIFADNAGVPGAVLGSATPIAGAGYDALTFTFPIPVPVAQNQKIWIGICADTNFADLFYTWGITDDPSDPTLVGWIGTSPTYASFPDIPGGLAPADAQYLRLDILNDSASAVGDPNRNDAGGTGYLIGTNSGDADWYLPLPVDHVLTSVVAVTTRAWMRKTDAGYKTAAVRMKSGGTTVQSPSIILSGSVKPTPGYVNMPNYTWVWRTESTDPATGSAWTVAAVDAVQFGPIVTS